MTYIEDLYNFLGKISLNNNREWFGANRATYDRLRDCWLADVDRLIGFMSTWEPAMKSQTARSSTYRFYRDTRFSPDKSPYKTFFSAALSPYGRNTAHAGYYLEIGIGESSGIYGGLWCPDASLLKKMRHAIVDNIEEFSAIIETPEMKRLYPGWVGESLKTIPKGWPKDHPQATLLRLKDYGKFCPLNKDWFMDSDWPRKTSERLSLLKPFVDFINYSLAE